MSGMNMNNIDWETIETIDHETKYAEGLSPSRHGTLVRQLMVSLNNCIPFPSVVSYITSDYSQADYLTNLRYILDTIYDMAHSNT